MASPIITLTRGLPGSGKTSWAKAWVAEDPDRRVRVNRDDLRGMLFGRSSLTNNDEALVTQAEERAVRAALEAGRDVVVDAMHLAARYVKRWEKVGSVRIQPLALPLAECIARDAARPAPLGGDVIRSIAKRYSIPEDGTLPVYSPQAPAPNPGAPRFAPAPEWDPNLPTAVLIDTDGTVADLAHRSPFAKDESLYLKDGVFEDVAAMALEALTAERDALKAAQPPCDGGCSIDTGPEETCSLHGRPVAEVWDIAQGFAEQRNAAKARVSVLEETIREALDVCRPGASVPLGVSEARHWDRLLAETHRILADALAPTPTDQEGDQA